MKIDRSDVTAENGFLSNSMGLSTNIADSYASVTVGFEKLEVGQTPIALTPSVYGDAVRAIILIEGGTTVRVRTSGENPDATTGLKFSSEDYIELTSRDEVEGFRILATSGTAILNIEYKA